MGFIAPLIGAAVVAHKTVSAYKKAKAPTPAAPTPEAPAAPAPAVAVSAPDSKQETGVDSTGERLKRKARGKKGLMINAVSNTSGGGLAGGTGLNI